MKKCSQKLWFMILMLFVFALFAACVPAEGEDDPDDDLLDEAVTSLEIDLLENGALDVITSNIGLPQEGLHGAVIEWSSNRPDIVANDGTVEQPAYHEEDVDVTLTATLTLNGDQEEKTFDITVLRADFFIPESVGRPDTHFDPWSDEERETMQEAMRDAYETLGLTGFNFGSAARDAFIWDGIYMQDFFSPDSLGQDPNLGVSLAIVYNLELETAFIIKDYIFSAYVYNNAEVGAKNVAGAPVSNAFEVDGHIVQNFENGHYIFMEDTPEDGAFVLNQHIDESTGDVIDFAPEVPDNIGRPDANYDVWTQEQRDALTAAMVAEYGRLLNDEFDPGTPLRDAFIWEGIYMQDFFSPDSTGSDPWHGVSMAIVYNLELDTAFSVKDGIFSAYVFNNPEVSNLTAAGAPIDNRITIEGLVYQNFENGYYTFALDAPETIAFHANVHFDYALETEIPLEGVPGNVGQITDTHILPDGFDQETITDAFIDAYLVMFNDGFNMGNAASGVKDWEGILVQDFANTDSSANPWGDGRGLVIAFNETLETAFVVKDAFFLAYAGIAVVIDDVPMTIGQFGEPLGNDFEHEGVAYQNFEHGYIMIEEEVITFVEGETKTID